MSSKVIITCAVTGSIHTPTMSPHLPVTPDEIADQAVEAAQAGAAILRKPGSQPLTPLFSCNSCLASRTNAMR
jgi:hypothetical protein